MLCYAKPFYKTTAADWVWMLYKSFTRKLKYVFTRGDVVLLPLRRVFLLMSQSPCPLFPLYGQDARCCPLILTPGLHSALHVSHPPAEMKLILADRSGQAQLEASCLNLLLTRCIFRVFIHFSARNLNVIFVQHQISSSYLSSVISQPTQSRWM